MRSDTAPAATVAISATFTAEPIAHPLDHWLQTLGIPHAIQFGPYNQVFQQLLDAGSLISRNGSGINVLLVNLQDWSQGDGLLQEQAQQFILALEAFQQRVPTTLLICFCPPAPTIDQQLAANITKIEEGVARYFQSLSSVHIITVAELFDLYPVEDYYNAYTARTADIPYTETFFVALATMIARRLEAIRRLPYKVVVLDCDETLWSGICGEDGARGVRLDHPRRALQAFMLGLHELGVLLCLCSKNSEADVWNVFQRGDMLLCHEHVVAWRINWRSKSENLQSLAQELGLGLDSFIFVDDNPIECAEVQAQLPEVLTLQLPGDEQEIPQFLKHVWAFDVPRVTEDDIQRPRRYQQDLRRKQFRSQAPTLQEFLEGLELEIRFTDLSNSDLPRVAQLTQRTNQFNCTTIRRSQSEIEDLCRRDGHEGFAVEVADKFGDYGLVGAVIFNSSADALHVDTFLLSCRVLGRTVEGHMLRRLAEIADRRGATTVNVAYRMTEKNMPARDFLEHVGATYCRETEQGMHYAFPVDTLLTLDLQKIVSHSRTSSAAAAAEAPLAARGAADPVQASASITMNRIATNFREAVQIQRYITSILKQRPIQQECYAAPQTELEQLLADAWERILHIERPGRDDNFFDLGGDSLSAFQLTAELHQTLDVQLTLTELLQTPVLKTLAEKLQEQLLLQVDEYESDALVADVEDTANFADTANRQ